MKYTSRSMRELNEFTENYTGSKVKERGVKKKKKAGMHFTAIHDDL